MASTSSVLSSLSDKDLITIMGYSDKIPYGKIKNAVIYLGGNFYYKSDTNNLVKIEDSSGKKRLYRKSSKLIQEIAKDKFVHKNNIVYTEDGIALDKRDPDTVIVNGNYTRRCYTVEIDGTLYLKSNPEVVRCNVSSEHILKENAIELSKKVYGSRKLLYVKKSFANSLVQIEDDGNAMALKRDSSMRMNAAGEIVYNSKDEAARHAKLDVFYKFRDSTNPQLDRQEYLHMWQEDLSSTTIYEPLGLRVHVNWVKELDRIYHDVILVQQAKATAALKASLKYDDDGPDENMAKTVKKINASYPGKSPIYNPSRWDAVVSRTCKDVGGLKYTFGLEIETSQGMLPGPLAEELMVKIVGDRSIGAGEYVSPVLHGDKGIEYIKKLCEALAAYTFVDNRCGIHFHVGGMEGVKNVEDVNFTRHFAINSIKLGAQIEEELYKSLPPSRSPNLKHCHSIKRWGDINEENWRQYLAAFVFGEYEENWKKPWSFANYSYGTPGMSRNDKVDTWCPGRYKWLNLVHILTRSSFQTCELRIFAGSTNFDKIYNYLLTSMAFVWFVENRPALIQKGNVTLSLMFDEAFKKHPELSTRLKEFYKARTERFKRDNIYSLPVPKAIF